MKKPVLYAFATLGALVAFKATAAIVIAITSVAVGVVAAAVKVLAVTLGLAVLIAGAWYSVRALRRARISREPTVPEA